MMLHSQIIGQGVPFIILHGLLGSGDNWKSLGNKFSENGYEVHLIDQRNHGRSFHSDEFNYQLLVQDIKEYCSYYQLDNILLLGHSMGGKAAMLFAVSYPSKVSKLIVADIGPKEYPQHHQDIFKALSLLDFTELRTRSNVEDFLSDYIKETGTLQFLLKSLYWKNKGELGLRFNLQGLTQNIEEVGKALPQKTQFTKETLFLRGDKSNYIVDTDDILIRMHFPNVEIQSVANAGHWLHAENPSDFYRYVVNFL